LTCFYHDCVGAVNEIASDRDGDYVFGVVRKDELLLMRVQAQQPQQALLDLVNPQRPFERLLLGQLQVLLGWNVQELPFAWSGESPGF
jgi:hypothetical protein